VADVVAYIGAFDLDDVGTLIREHRRAEPSSDERRQIQDCHVLQDPFHTPNTERDEKNFLHMYGRIDCTGASLCCLPVFDV
jgi:hypothetical protein